MNKLYSLEELDAIIAEGHRTTCSPKIAKQLLDCMRDNERLRQGLEDMRVTSPEYVTKFIDALLNPNKENG